MKYNAVVVSHKGNVREVNEDNAFINGYYGKNGNCLSWGHESNENEIILAAVFDGMGGEANGEIASEMAARNMMEFIGKDFSKNVDFYIEKTNADIAMFDKEHNMGTTFVALFEKHGKYQFYNVGDSRGYLYRAGKLSQMTLDHNLVRRMQQEGVLTKEQADRHPQRNSISQFLGMKENGNLIKPDCHKVEMVAAKEGDIILLCTDGLTEMVPDGCIKDIFMKDCPTKEKAQLLLEQALEAGGKDNITIILVEVI